MDSGFLEKIQQLQGDYYSQNGKNTFFKKSQKTECAAIISNKMDIEQLIANTMYNVPGTNKVYFDYTVFKLYATPDNYDAIITNVLRLFQNCIDEYGSYESHINLLSYTVSACERYKSIFPVLFDECFKKGKTYSDKLSKLYIYNTPSAMATIIQIMTPLVDPIVRPKINYYTKAESSAALEVLLRG